MTKDEALKLSLEALESCDAAHITDGGRQWYDEKLVDKAITAIKEALAQSEQEPCGGCGGSGWVTRDPDIGTDQECFVCGGSGTYPKEPEQEPVAVVRWNDIGHISWRTHVMLSDNTPLYTAPLQRTWVGLTDEELSRIEGTHIGRSFAKAIEAKLKEKNG